MLISDKSRFIFIHVPKTAGTSVLTALTPFTSSKWSLFVERLFRKAGIQTLNVKSYHTHIRAKELLEKIGAENFKSYFSFAFIRNPWDMQASLYAYIIKSPVHRLHEFVKGLGSFDSYLEWRCSDGLYLQKDFVYSDNGELLINFLGRYENLDADFKLICDQIGITAELPVLNVSKSKPYQEYYTKESIELVRRAFFQDIELFKYEFE
ncbi:MAG: sulfotransferase family 2 domain-containing protein [Geobacteraceae bacterium]|nr:sulfotransferase family 2 domain-containing protein [Geobacteraceae bacterium]